VGETGVRRTAGADHRRSAPTEIGQRIARLRPPEGLVVLRDRKAGQRCLVNPEYLRMGMHQRMGEHYPFTLADKLALITEPSPWYTAEGGASSPWPEPGSVELFAIGSSAILALRRPRRARRDSTSGLREGSPAQRLN
jgi:hypothetical protein